MSKKFYISTPIYYASDNLHLGHCYTTVIADAVARYKRLHGFDVMFLTGTDEHGQKIESKAILANMSPKEYVDKILINIKALWKLLDISYTRFIRTTDKYHIKTVQNVFNTLYNNGDIYKGIYSGKYCKPCEAFFLEHQLVDNKCPDCGREVSDFSEEAYFFKLTKYQKLLEEFYNNNSDFIEPKSRATEMIKNFIEAGLNDVCVSPTSINWGIPIEFDNKHIIYVWIDALINYISALGYGNDKYNDFEKYWPCDLHLMSKEIVRFHFIIWPALLMSMNLPLPKKIFGHGWLLFGGDKMSKSKGNVIDPTILCKRYGVDAIRYFLLREIQFDSDGIFLNEILLNRINADLANNLGNLISRTIAMIFKYFDGSLSNEKISDDNLDEPLKEICICAKKKVEDYMEMPNPSKALSEIFKVISRANKYIDETEPWLVAKNLIQRPRLCCILYNLSEALRIVSILLEPFIPNIAKKIQYQLNCSDDIFNWYDVDLWGKLPDNNSFIKDDILFPRIDIEKELKELESL